MVPGLLCQGVNMSDENIIQTGIRVDISQLKTGMAEAAAIVKDSSAEMAAATTNSTSAVKAEADAATAAAAAKKAAAAAARLLAAQTTEARHASHLLGDEVGVRLPRALQGVLATSKLLGPMLTAAFPVIVAIAFVEIADKVAGKIEDCAAAARGFGKDVKEAYEEAIKENRALYLESLKLTEQWRAVNLVGLQGSSRTAQEMENSRAAAANYGREIIKARAALEALENQKNHVSFNSLTRSNKEQEVLNGKINEQRSLIAQLEKEQRSAFNEARSPVKAAEGQHQSKEEGESAAEAAAREREQAYNKEQQDAKEALSNQAAIDRSRIKSAHDALETIKGDREVSAAEEAGYWMKIGLAAKAGSVEQAEAFRLAARARAESTKQEKTELDKINAYLKESAEKQMRARQELAREVMAGAVAHEKSAAAIQIEQAKIDFAHGSITALGEAQAIAAAHGKEYAAELAAVKKEIEEINKLPDTDPEKKVKLQQASNKLGSIGGAAGLAGSEDKEKIAQTIAAPYVEAFHTISNSFNQGLNSWISGQKKFGAAMRQSAKGMVMGIISEFEKMGEKWIEKHVIMKAVSAVFHTSDVAQHATAATAKAGIDTVGLTAQLSNQIAAHTSATVLNVDSAQSYAATAGAAALASLAAIPIVGPGIAPAGASAIMATGESFVAMASHEYGGVIAGQYGTAVPILGHAGERVLSVQETQKFNSLVNNSNGSGRNMTWNQQNHFHGQSDQQFRSQLMKHADAVFNAGKAHLRKLGKNVG